MVHSCSKAAAYLPLVASLFVVVDPATAQDPGMPQPASELARLKPFEGHWEGTGTATMPPAAKETKWVSQMSRTWVLGGFWLQNDETVTFEGGKDVLHFRDYTGWDAENKCFVTLTIDNTGEGAFARSHVSADGNVLTVIERLREDGPAVERQTATLQKDGSWTFQLTVLPATGAAAEMVRGTFRKVDKARPQALDAVHAMTPASNPAMARIARMGGEYDVKGTMSMMPGAPEMKIKGRDSVRSLFGGHVVQVLTTGSAEGMPGTYEAHNYYVADRASGAYRILFVDSMGMVGQAAAHFAGDDKLVSLWSGMRMGQPATARGILTLDAAGRPARIVSHSCIGAHDPVKDFDGAYAPAK